VPWEPVTFASDDGVVPLEAVDLVRELVYGRRPAWHVEAACRGRGVNQWFPEQGESLEPARVVCASCPVRAECLQAGMDEAHGVWAGTSAVQRRKVRRETPRAPLPAVSCEHCGIEFTPPSRTSRYCGRKCTKAASDARRRAAA
jgi:WhiB family redox-sensing transcriptional regulator